MYKLMKAKGHRGTISVENTDTKANVNIGPLSMEAMKILEEDGFVFNDESAAKNLMYVDEWNVKISDTAGKALAKLSLPMHKPKRDQRKVKSEQEDIPADEIDAIDVLFGLADYK